MGNKEFNDWFDFWWEDHDMDVFVCEITGNIKVTKDEIKSHMDDAFKKGGGE